MALRDIHLDMVRARFYSERVKFEFREVSSTLWYMGVSDEANSLFSDSKWMIFRLLDINGDISIVPETDEFKQVFDDRATYTYNKAISDIALDSLVTTGGDPIGTVVANISSIGGKPPITYTVDADPDGKFEIVGTELRIKQLVSSPNVHSVTIKATDADLKSIIETFNITVESALIPSVYSMAFNGVDTEANDEAGSVDVDLCGANFSTAAWVKLNNSSSRGVILNKWQSGKSSFILNSFAAKIEAWVSANGSSNENTTSATSLIFGDWYHVVMTFAPTELKIYLNGVIDKTAAVSATTIFKSDAQVNMGFYTGVAWSFDGRIKEGICYNKTLTPAEVLTLYNNDVYLDPEEPTAPSGLRLNYKAGDTFFQDVDTNYKFDEVVNGNKMICSNLTMADRKVDTP